MIRTQDDVSRGLEALVRLDPRLEAVVALAGEVPVRRSLGGLPGLVSTVVGQQVSGASARAIFARFAALADLEDPEAILRLDDAAFRAAGLSAAKQRTVLGLAEAARDGRLDLLRIGEIASGDAVAELTALRGIGAWTAECWLLFSAGHPDVFPAGDLALQVGVARALQLEARPKEKALGEIARAWSPHRSVAARLFWSYYGAVTLRDAAPAAPTDPALSAAESPPAPAPPAPKRRRTAGFTKATR